MGEDSLIPFLEYPQTYSFVLSLTSNKSAADFQRPELFLQVARKVLDLNKRYGNCGLVVGATQGADLAKIRELSDELIFLIPGIGAQGGDLAQTVGCVKGRQHNFLINSSRGIIYASNGKDFAQAAGQSARKLMQDINALL
jgi:orotidine-5'-phosphate decarboxylase